MKQIFLFSLAFALSASGLWAQQPTPAPGNWGGVDTTWRGIRFQIYQVQRIPGDRLLVIVTILATPKAAPNGTLIGVMPPGASLAPGNGPVSAENQPRPFSVASAVMTDEATKQTYQAVPPIPGGQNYVPAEIFTTLRPNSSDMVTVQFPIPPPPQPVDGIVPQQKVSILLPNALGPITHIVIPPPTPPAAPTAKH